MYAVGFTKMVNPAGNDGLQKLHVKTPRLIMERLTVMRKVNDEIFIVNDFTQKMCEMSQAELWSYCNSHYVFHIRGEHLIWRYGK